MREPRLTAKEGRRVSPVYLDENDQPGQANVIYMRREGRRRIAFGWYGGKFSHLDWLLPPVENLNTTGIQNRAIRERVDYVCRCLSNRAGVRL